VTLLDRSGWIHCHLLLDFTSLPEGITLLLAVVEPSTDAVEVTPATTTPTEEASQSEDGRDEAIEATTATTDRREGVGQNLRCTSCLLS
jgi:hypothetical protein